MTYPTRVFLLRGNHESRSTTGFFGFKEECLAKLGLPAYYRFLLAFECMPLCAVIETRYGRLFAAHGGTFVSLSVCMCVCGLRHTHIYTRPIHPTTTKPHTKSHTAGISPEIRTLAEIEAIDRFVEPDCKGALCDILWWVLAPFPSLQPSLCACSCVYLKQAG